MSKSRNERRKAARERQFNKLCRLAKAELGRQADERRLIVKDNMSKPIERTKLSLGSDGTMTGGYGYYPQSSFSTFAEKAHRGHVSSNIARVPLYAKDDSGRER